MDPKRDRDAERWKALVIGIRGDGRIKRTPFMPGDLPIDFIPRPTEYEALKAAVLIESQDQTVSVTTGLRGAGGYGKTTLVNKLCRDPDIRFEFADGILRVEIGKERGDVHGLITDLIEKLDPKGKRPGFIDVTTASEHLGELLGESRILLVIDDVWREAQLRPFLRGGQNCVRLITTRISGILPSNSRSVTVDEMRAVEATGLIGVELPDAARAENAMRLASLAARLGHWAQMLAIANGWLRSRVARGEPLAAAIGRFEQRLARAGQFAFDPANETQRSKAIRLCIEASIEDLDAVEVIQFATLGILPEDEDVPLDVVQALWAETAGLEEDQADDLARRLDALSLVQSLDLGRRTLRMHDNILWYLRERLGVAGLKAAHSAMVRMLRPRCSGIWSALPVEQSYGWRFLITHLIGADDKATAEYLLSDYSWIRAKLHATDALSLYSSYISQSTNSSVKLVGLAIGLSLPTLMRNKLELALQIFGRLGNFSLPCANTAKLDPDFRPKPRWSSLTPPGVERLGLYGHGSSVRCATFSPNGMRIVTASDDATARIWDVVYGTEIAVLRGHDAPVTTAGFSPTGDWIVTGAEDGSARVWDTQDSTQISALVGRRKKVRSAAFAPEGTRIMTVFEDQSANVWDAVSGSEVNSIHGLEVEVRTVALAPDGALVVTSLSDGRAFIRDAVCGAELTELRGHEKLIINAAFSADRTRLVTASEDQTARVWDCATGGEVAVLRGHKSFLWSAAFSPDGARVVTASADRTARIWDAVTGAEIAALRGHEASVYSAAFSPEGTCIVTASGDGTARLWEVPTNLNSQSFSQFREEVRTVAFSPDGARLTTVATDSVARILDAVTGAEVSAFEGRATVSSDGAIIVTAFPDGIVRVWDVVTEAEISVFRRSGGAVLGAVLSRNGARVVTSSLNDFPRIIDANTGNEIAVLRHDSWMKSAVFSPDGKRILTTSMGSSAHMWDASTGTEIAMFNGHQHSVLRVAFFCDGGRIITTPLTKLLVFGMPRTVLKS